ncbi:MAG: hypothetical protein HDS72_04370 [Bacteroidales bacterium]|nr:hypothetical protein [Bacteroidales bacterium]
MIEDKISMPSSTPGFAPEIAGAPGASSKPVEKPVEKPVQEEDSSLRSEHSGDDELVGYDKQIAALEAAAAQLAPETEEQRKKRERQERSKKIIAAMTDGAMALSNLYFTTQYAPNSYQPQHSQLGKVNEHIEAMKAERRADGDRYNNYILRLGDLQNAKARTLREMQAQHEAQKLAREKAAREAALHPFAMAEAEATAKRREQEALSAQYAAEYAPAMQEAKLATEHERAGAQKASATASYAKAAAAGGNRTVYGRFDGKDYYNKRDYDKAVLAAADEYNKRHPQSKLVQEVVYDDEDMTKGGQKWVKRPTESIATTWEDWHGDPKDYDTAKIASQLERALQEERNGQTTGQTPEGGQAAGYKDSPTA